MNKLLPWFKAATIAVALSAVATKAAATEFVVAYDGFYDRLKVVNKGEFQYAQVNFYLSDIATNEVCTIKSGKIITEKQEFDLTYTDKAQLLLPFDKQLDTDKAVIVVQPENPKHDCQLKLQIEATDLADFELSKANLYALNQEFEELLSDLSGFFVSKLMWFLLPEQQGVVLKFDTQDAVSANAVSCKELRCSVKVSGEWQDDKSVLTSHGKLISATPWIVK
ncbi:DUF2987 domain-containing protein [Pseudoalteromonas gelatinilytica]|uniref:DUF2987 domain-containing protein n=1 Tax=Pseudoalteromonas gelatinilytica TaxID=1703256 RepID=A0ABQ1TZ95_9GAMM|nr:DUF2987 domain-containing protein [Pseudoalteromonas profundi]GGF05807.1 hypothetical protein GCM10008027_33380 [Pseudoalteromonas profundi]